MKIRGIFYFLIILFIHSLAVGQTAAPAAKQNKKKYKKWQRGFQFSYDYSYRWLTDNPRYKGVFYDTTISDKSAIEMRNSFEGFKKSYTAGLLFERPINNKFFFQTGAIINNVGETIKLDKVSDPRIKNLFYYDPKKPFVKVSYTSFDIPLAVRFTFGQKSRYDTQRSAVSYLKFNRNFIGMGGIQASYLLSNGTPFLENSGMSFVLRGIAGIGISQGLGEKMTLNLMLTARHAINPMYLDDALNSYYYSLGLTAQILFKKKIKEKKKANTTIVDACLLHKLRPRDPKQKKKAIFGFTFGANVSQPFGSDAAKKDIQYNPSFWNSLIVPKESSGRKLPLTSPQWALHMEYNFLDNRLGIFSDPGFIRRGYFARYDYKDAFGTLRTQTTLKKTYIDVPLNIRVALSEWVYVFAGGNISVLVRDKVKFYAQYFDDTSLDLNPTAVKSVLDTYTYYAKPSKAFVWGYTGGIGFVIGDNADFTFRVNKTSDYIKDYSLYGINAQASLTYLFKRRK